MRHNKFTRCGLFMYLKRYEIWRNERQQKRTKNTNKKDMQKHRNDRIEENKTKIKKKIMNSYALNETNLRFLV